MYDNPKDFGHRTTSYKERSALITAMTLGKILNRIVILPKFHCYPCDELPVCTRITNHCAFHALFHVKSFDSHFSGLYREHGFLEHPKVPLHIKKAVSKKMYIAKKTNKKPTLLANGDTTKVETNNNRKIATQDIINWFGQGPLSELSVLNFNSLYMSLHFNDHSWLNLFDISLKFSSYWQEKME